jgi:hypothetical protein
MNGMEALFLTEGPKNSMMEYHAVTGVWPASNAEAAYDPRLAKGARVGAIAIRPGGAVDVTFSTRIPEFAGKVLTIRAGQASAAGNLSTVWSCGHAEAKPFVASGEDKTTISDADLPSPCRAHE